jgi:hypothetical protein
MFDTQTNTAAGIGQHSHRRPGLVDSAFLFLGLVVTQALARCCPKSLALFHSLLEALKPPQASNVFRTFSSSVILSSLYKFYRCNCKSINTTLAEGAVIKLSLADETWCSLPCFRRCLGSSPVRYPPATSTLVFSPAIAVVRYPHFSWC